MNWNASKSIGLGSFIFLLLLILAIMFYWRQDLWLNVPTPTSGGVIVEGIVSGDTEKLEIQIKSGIEPLFTQANFFGPTDSCTALYALKASATELQPELGPDWWRIKYTIPSDAEIHNRWRFGFSNPLTGEWLDEESLKIEGSALVHFEGAFAFQTHIGQPGVPCTQVLIKETLAGDEQKLVLTVQAESPTEAKYTQVKFFAPAAALLPVRDVFASSTVLAGDKKTWVITFNLPADLEVDKRWSFGFLNPQTGLWLTPDRLEFVGDEFILHNNSLAFKEYCDCE